MFITDSITAPKLATICSEKPSQNVSITCALSRTEVANKYDLPRSTGCCIFCLITRSGQPQVTKSLLAPHYAIRLLVALGFVGVSGFILTEVLDAQKALN